MCCDRWLPPSTESAHIVDSEWEWVDAQLTYTQGLVFNPFGPSQLQFITGQTAAFQRRADGRPAAVGEVFHIRGIVSVVGTSADAPIMEILIDQALAPDLDFAISPEHPVRCFFRPDIGKPDKEDASSTCSQTPAAGTQGSFFCSRPLEPGQSFEVQVPVVVKAVKNGIATGDAAKFGALVRPASATEAIAEQHLFVAAAPPGGGTDGSGSTGGTGGTTPGAKPGAKALMVTRQGRTTRRVLRFRLVKRSRVSGAVQRRTVVNTANSKNARQVR